MPNDGAAEVASLNASLQQLAAIIAFVEAIAGMMFFIRNATDIELLCSGQGLPVEPGDMFWIIIVKF
jgi:hypothetical protein